MVRGAPGGARQVAGWGRRQRKGPKEGVRVSQEGALRDREVSKSTQERQGTSSPQCTQTGVSGCSALKE